MRNRIAAFIVGVAVATVLLASAISRNLYYVVETVDSTMVLENAISGELSCRMFDGLTEDQKYALFVYSDSSVFHIIK